MLCKVSEFKKALDDSLLLLDDKYLITKNIDPSQDSIEPIQKLKFFIELINKKLEYTDDYSKVIAVLDKDTEIKRFSLTPLLGYLGKILDGIQLLKNNSMRNKNAVKYVKSNLERTSHDFILNKLSDELKTCIDSEIIKSSALYIFLEASYFAFGNIANPIKTLRRSMGDRLPEEYFSELISGWIIEHIFIQELNSLGLTATKTGADSEFSIKFKKPKNMAIADIELKLNESTMSIELQRVGKATKEGKYFKTALKIHKIDNKDNITVLWFGKNPKGIANRNCILYDRILIFSNSSINNRNLKWKNDNIYFNDLFVRSNSILYTDGIKYEKFVKLMKKVGGI